MLHSHEKRVGSFQDLLEVVQMCWKSRRSKRLQCQRCPWGPPWSCPAVSLWWSWDELSPRGKCSWVLALPGASLGSSLSIQGGSCPPWGCLQRAQGSFPQAGGKKGHQSGAGAKPCVKLCHPKTEMHHGPELGLEEVSKGCHRAGNDPQNAQEATVAPGCCCCSVPQASGRIHRATTAPPPGRCTAARPHQP